MPLSRSALVVDTPGHKAACVQADPVEAAFRRNIAALASAQPATAMSGDQHQCGRSLDALASDAGRLRGAGALNLALMRRLRPTRTAAAVVTVKNEGCSLLECVAHNRAVGFEHVFLYTNDNSDGSDPLLEALDRTDYVTVIRNEVGPQASPQVKAYEHSIHLLRSLRDFEWVSYFDADEFLIPSARYDYSVIATVAALRRRYPGRGPSAICFNWDWYGSQGAIHRGDGLVQERFSHSAAHPIVKSLVRLADVGTMALVHMPGPDGLDLVNAAFDPITVGPDCTSVPIDPVHGRLSHYYQKSFEEFGIKSHRGRGSAPGGVNGKALETFFEWDVSADPATHNPAPPTVLARVHQNLAALMADPAIAAAAKLVDQAYAALSNHVHGGDVEARFKAMQQRFQPAAQQGITPPYEGSDPRL